MGTCWRVMGLMVNGLLAVCSPASGQDMPLIFDITTVWQINQPDGMLMPVPLRPLAVTTPKPRTGMETSLRYRDAESCHQDIVTREQVLLVWADNTHCTFSWRANAVARTVNDWFVVPASTVDVPKRAASSLITLLYGVGWDQIQGTYFTRSISSSFQLPAVEQRFSILVESNEQAINPTEIGAPSPLQQQVPAMTSSAIALQWRSLAERYTGLNLDMGVRGGPEIFLRARYERRIALGPKYRLHFNQSLIEASHTQAESYSEADIERSLGSSNVMRLSSTWDWQQIQSSVGEQWVHALTIAHSFEDHSIMTGGLSVAGISAPEFGYQTWGPGASFHQSFWRPWLFYELRPAYTYVRYAPSPSMQAVTLQNFLAGHIEQGVIFEPTTRPRWVVSMEVALGMMFGQ